jgi:hypothetical protein
MNKTMGSPMDALAGRPAPHPILLHPWRAASVLAGITLAFALADAIGYALIGPATFRHHVILSEIDLRFDANITTFYSALVLLGAAAACLVNAYGYRQPPGTGIGRFLPGWRALALIFAYLAVDEAAQFHEQLTRFGPHLTGGLAFLGERSWVLFYVPPALAAAAMFVPFLRRLGWRDAGLIILAGAIYVLSAAGIELVGSWLRSGMGFSRDDMPVALCALAEETGEVLGITLFIGVALSHAARNGAGLALHVVDAARAVPSRSRFWGAGSPAVRGRPGTATARRKHGRV